MYRVIFDPSRGAPRTPLRASAESRPAFVGDQQQLRQRLAGDDVFQLDLEGRPALDDTRPGGNAWRELLVIVRGERRVQAAWREHGGHERVRVEIQIGRASCRERE